MAERAGFLCERAEVDRARMTAAYVYRRGT
jgi:hypothetical protein